jgi:hypothetical protein
VGDETGGAIRVRHGFLVLLGLSQKNIKQKCIVVEKINLSKVLLLIFSYTYYLNIKYNPKAIKKMYAHGFGSVIVTIKQLFL